MNYLYKGIMLLFLCGSCVGHSGHNGDAHNHEQEHEHADGHTHDHEGEHKHEGEHEHDYADGHDHDHESEHTHADGQTHDHDHAGESAKQHDDHAGEILFHDAMAKEVGVKVETLNPQTFASSIKTTGEIVAAQGDEQLVVATVSGVLTWGTNVVIGQEVNKNTLLALISSEKLQDGDPVQKARIAYQAAQQEYERTTTLLQDQIVSQKEYNAIKEKYETAQEAYLRLAEKHTERGHKVQPPFHGFVKEVYVQEGTYVSVGTPLMTVVKDTKIMLKADLSERYYPQLPSIVSARFKLPYSETVYDLAQLNGKRLSYGRSALSDSHYIPIQFELDNRDEFYPGAYVEVYLLSQPMEQVLALPRTAFVEEQGIYSVYVQVHDEVYKKQVVTLGMDNGEKVQILSGLHPGDKVVTEGAYHIKLSMASSVLPAHSHSH